MTVRKATPCTLASRQISIAFEGNCQDPDRCVGVWILSPNRASGFGKVQHLHQNTLRGAAGWGSGGAFSSTCLNPPETWVAPIQCITPPDSILGSAVIAGVARELINRAISCLSLNAELAVWLSGPPQSVDASSWFTFMLERSDTLTDSTQILTNKTQLVAPFYDGYIYA